MHRSLPRRFHQTLAGAGLLAALALPSAAADPWGVQADAGWVRGTVEGQTGSGAYLRLTSRADAQLVGAASPAAERVEIHEMRMVNDRMTMRRVERLALPAGTTVSLEHDYHVMLIGLRHQLVPGQDLPLTLDITDLRGRHHPLELSLPVRPLGTPVPRAPAGGHG